MAGKVSGNQAMAERGEERKVRMKSSLDECGTYILFLVGFERRLRNQLLGCRIVHKRILRVYVTRSFKNPSVVPILCSQLTCICDYGTKWELCQTLYLAAMVLM